MACIAGIPPCMADTGIMAVAVEAAPLKERVDAMLTTGGVSGFSPLFTIDEDWLPRRAL